MKSIYASIFAWCLIFSMALYLSGCGKSCEERGGEVVMKPTVIYHASLKMPISQMVPVCKVEQEGK